MFTGVTGVKFVEVGRDKRTWECKLDPVTDLYDQMYKAVKKNGRILSSQVEFFFDDERQETGSIWVGGVRKVGRFELQGFETALIVNGPEY